MRIVYAVVTAVCGAGAGGFHAWADRHVERDDRGAHVQFERRETSDRTSSPYEFDRGRDASRVEERSRWSDFRCATVRRGPEYVRRDECPPRRGR